MTDFASSLLPVLGGSAGLVVIVYMGGMLWYERKKVAELEALRRDMREIRGMLLMLKGGRR